MKKEYNQYFNLPSICSWLLTSSQCFFNTWIFLWRGSRGSHRDLLRNTSAINSSWLSVVIVGSDDRLQKWHFGYWLLMKHEWRVWYWVKTPEPRGIFRTCCIARRQQRRLEPPRSSSVAIHYRDTRVSNWSGNLLPLTSPLAASGVALT